MPRREVLFEGLSEQEILNLPQEELENLILLGEPIVFRAGSAVVLGSFKVTRDRLVVELAQIEGGGEGVLPTLIPVILRFARRRGAAEIEWLVFATNCARAATAIR